MQVAGVTNPDPFEIPELLAPAGSSGALHAAVAAGADAVYLSGKQFGARKYAQNFDEDALREAISYAHLCGVRVYVTVNTLIHDRELPDLADYLVWLYERGVDAILVQDTGVAALAREIVPGLTLHASTQMTITDREGVAMARHLGFSRVVLAREVALEEIVDILNAPDCGQTGLEVFIHGALCYCYSGQCLLSSVIGGRSGNRGTCAQPCRKRYTLVAGAVDEFGKPESLSCVPLPHAYLLSTRDLAAYPNLKAIARSQIAALKVEGRMRTPEYVAVVVSIYRKALDAIASGDWSPKEDDMRDLALAFNRGFTAGYLSGAGPGEVMGRDRPDNRGICIGTVIASDPRLRTVGVQLSGGIRPEQGDGLMIADCVSGREEGMLLSLHPRSTGKMIVIPVQGPINPGSKVYLTRREELVRMARKIVGKAPRKAFIPVDLSVTIAEDRIPLLEGSVKGKDGSPLTVCHRSDVPLETALRAPLTSTQIEMQMKKAGNSPFFVRSCAISYPGGLFAPISSLNRMRRVLLSAVEDAILASWSPDHEKVRTCRTLAGAFRERQALTKYLRKQDPPRRPVIMVYVNELRAAMRAVQAGCQIVCFEPPSYSSENEGELAGRSRSASGDLKGLVAAMDELAGICRAYGGIPVWKWPRITHGVFLERALRSVPGIFKTGVTEVLLENPSPADAILQKEPRCLLSGGTGLNIFNHRSVAALCPPFHRVTLSPELTRRDIKELMMKIPLVDNPPQIACLVEGNLEVMVSEDRLLSLVPEPETPRRKYGFIGLRDERNRIFPVRIDSSGRTRVFNAVETCLIDYLPILVSSGVETLVIDARNRGERYAGKITEIYHNALHICGNKPGTPSSSFAPLKRQIKSIALGGITTGSFIRGLKEEEMPPISIE
jgi:putative protease